jgi:hypothetical protein
MSLGPKHRNYPGGFFIPVTFADDGAWHYAQFSYDLTGSVQVGGMAYGRKQKLELKVSAFLRIYIMSFESRFPAPTTFLVDDVQFSPADSVYFVPRLFHLVETGDPNTFEVRLYVRNMALERATARLQLSLPPHLAVEGSAEKNITLPAGYVHGLHSSDSAGAGLLKWIVHGKRLAGDEVAVHYLGNTVVGSWTWRKELRPSLEFAHVYFTRGLIATRERVTLHADVRNEGTAIAPVGARIELATSSQLKPLSSLNQPIRSEIAPGRVVSLSWDFEAKAQGKVTSNMTLRAGDQTTESHAETWVENGPLHLEPDPEPMTWRDYALVHSGDLFLSFGPRRSDYGAFCLYYREGAGFRHVASGPYLAKVIFLESGKERERIIRYRPKLELNGDRGYLAADWTDHDGVRWKSAIEFQAPGSKQEIGVLTTLRVNARREILFFQGPLLLVGDGSTGLRKDSAQFPGIEWLQDGEVSSDHSNIPELRDERVPHPNKITVPVMGIVTDRKMVGIMWDPLQRWDGVNDRPSVFFDSPNRTLGQANHLIGLFLPSIPKWVDERTLKARLSYTLDPGHTLRLRFSFIAADHANDLTPVLYWYSKYGAPDASALDRTYQEELSLCNVQQPESNVEKKILKSLDKAEKALARQSPDGWWPWSYSDSTLIQILNWTHAENLDAYGTPGDTTIGAYSASYNNRYDDLELFRSARYTGDARLVEAATRALKRAEQFTRPEGAQPWELPIHTPDLLASLYGVSAFLEGYKMTGNPEYLERSRYWAETGLPFLYVWGAPDQPHMKGAGVAVYGGSFLDYLLLGQGITWCAMDYADSLIDLAADDPDGPWKKVAQSILYNVILQHKTTGPNAGKWPDWRDLTKNRVLADVWYASPQPGELLLKWLGKEAEPRTTIVKPGDKAIRITADGVVQSATYEGGRLIINLKPILQPMCRVAIAGVLPFSEARITPSPTTLRDISYDHRYNLAFVRFNRDGQNELTLELQVTAAGPQ